MIERNIPTGGCAKTRPGFWPMLLRHGRQPMAASGLPCSSRHSTAAASTTGGRFSISLIVSGHTVYTALFPHVIDPDHEGLFDLPYPNLLTARIGEKLQPIDDDLRSILNSVRQAVASIQYRRRLDMFHRFDDADFNAHIDGFLDSVAGPKGMRTSLGMVQVERAANLRKSDAGSHGQPES